MLVAEFHSFETLFICGSWNSIGCIKIYIRQRSVLWIGEWSHEICKPPFHSLMIYIKLQSLQSPPLTPPRAKKKSLQNSKVKVIIFLKSIQDKFPEEVEVFMRVTLFVLDVNCGDLRILGTWLRSAPGPSVLPLATDAHKRTWKNSFTSPSPPSFPLELQHLQSPSSGATLAQLWPTIGSQMCGPQIITRERQIQWWEYKWYNWPTQLLEISGCWPPSLLWWSATQSSEDSNGAVDGGWLHSEWQAAPLTSPLPPNVIHSGLNKGSLVQPADALTIGSLRGDSEWRDRPLII